jgi:hypothetical protein
MGVIMRIADHSKTQKLRLKKEAFVKTQETVSSSIAPPDEIRSSRPKMEIVAAIPAAAEVTSEERRHLVSEAAYYRAERRSFAPGFELDDWLNAESEIEMMLSTFSVNCLSKNL